MTKTASFPELYEEHLVESLFRPWAELTLDALRVTRGDHRLDVGCGNGIVARLARERVGDGGRVVGVDVSSGMLALARRLAPKVEWREGDAHATAATPVALVGMSAVANTVSDDGRERVVAAIVGDSAEVVRRYSDADGLAFGMLSNLAMARA